MNQGLEYYKIFIDGLVELRPSVSAKWVFENKLWPEIPESSENKKINLFIGSLDDSSKKILAKLLNSAYDSGIHDVLANLDDKVNLDGLCLIQEGHTLPVESFGTEMHYNFVCRCHGDEWPEEES